MCDDLEVISLFQGGPNAEYVLAAAIALRGHPEVLVIACDTDGVAEVASAIAGPTTLALAEAMGKSAPRALEGNDA